MTKTIFSWVNGQADDRISILDRGLAFGDGLFETMLVSDGKISLFEYHKQRLLQDAACLGILISPEDFLNDIKIALNHISNHSIHHWRLKYIVTRGNSDTGYAPNPRGKPNRILRLQKFDAGFARLLQQQGIKACTCNWRLPIQPMLAGIKHLNRIDQVMARQEFLDSDCFEGLMRDRSDCYIEGTMSNLFAVTQFDEIITPSLEFSGVSGVMRRFVCEEVCTSIGKEYEEAEINRMNEFKEVFVTNALMGILPVIAVDNWQFDIGPVTRNLQQALNECLKNTQAL